MKKFLNQKSKIIMLATSYLLLATTVLAQSSSNYSIRDYSFGPGGTENSSSDNFSLFGILGEQAQGDLESDNFQIGAGLPNTIMPNLPGAPTFTNPGENYDRLQFIINTSGNVSDVEYAIQITTDDDTNWSNPQYIQSDDTLGSVLGSEDFQTYDNWGGASGTYITNLAQDTTYKIRVKARQGIFTETGWGPEATAATLVPTLTFGVDANFILFNNLNPGNSYTDDTKSTTFTTSTNAYNGYIIYGFALNELTYLTHTIAHYASTNSSPTTWSGTGFGYTTNDSTLTGGTGDRFTSGGPKYAGFTETIPGDPVANTSGPVLTPIEDETYEVGYRVTVDGSQPAGSYTTVVVYIVVPTY